MTPVEAIGADAVVLWVAVHRDAGTLTDVAADGASGLCTAEVAWIRCPAASGPVTFRWGPAGRGDWVLSGQAPDGTWREGPVQLAPGAGAVAVVLPSDRARSGEIARLDPSTVTPGDVRDLFVRTGDHPVFPPSPGQLRALAALVQHPDPAVRRELPDAVLPWVRHTNEDPTPLGSPPVLAAGTLIGLARDEDPAVRRRIAARLRDVRDGPDTSSEVSLALSWLVTAGGGAQRAALVAMGARGKEGDEPALETWRVARVRMRDDGAPGRAAVKTLAALSTQLEVGGEVDPGAVLREVITLHPERTWSFWWAWRRDLGFDEELALRLFRETVGWSPSLLQFWARSAPDELEATLRRWEPGPPHTTRWLDLVGSLNRGKDERWQRLRDDKLSDPGGGPPPP